MIKSGCIQRDTRNWVLLGYTMQWLWVEAVVEHSTGAVRMDQTRKTFSCCCTNHAKELEPHT